MIHVSSERTNKGAGKGRDEQINERRDGILKKKKKEKRKLGALIRDNWLITQSTYCSSRDIISLDFQCVDGESPLLTMHSSVTQFDSFPKLFFFFSHFSKPVLKGFQFYKTIIQHIYIQLNKIKFHNFYHSFEK